MQHNIYSSIPHEDILGELLGQLFEINFREASKLKEGEAIQKKHYLVFTIDHLMNTAKKNGWQLCRANGQAYLYNGAYWKVIDREILQDFFGRAAAKIGVPFADSRFYTFRRDLILQFESDNILAAPSNEEGKTLINLLNGTYQIGIEKQELRSPKPEDFITYQLPFCFDPAAKATLFEAFLNKVLPDIESQKVLQEYLGYVFISPKRLKLEKVLLLFGGGANGKSVFIEVISALLGVDNVSRYGLESITSPSSYSRAELATKLLNLSTEISGKMDNGIFKQLASGECVEARQIYGRPFTMETYAKLLFSTNELPREVEQTNGFFRRWLIIPFNITIPEAEQDKELASKIIENELSGVFNWVIGGLERLLVQKRFTESNLIKKQSEDYRKLSDNVLMFLDEENFMKAVNETIPLKEVYAAYRIYCENNGYRVLLKFKIR